MLAVLSLLAPVFALLFIGILVERFRLVPQGGAATLNMLVFNLAMPCLIFSSMALSDPADLARGGYVGGILAGMLVCYALAHGLSLLQLRFESPWGRQIEVQRRMPKSKRPWHSLFFLSNTVSRSPASSACIQTFCGYIRR